MKIACNYMTTGSDKDKIEKLRSSQLKKIRLIKKLGREKKELLSLIKSHITDQQVVKKATRICSRCSVTIKS